MPKNPEQNFPEKPGPVDEEKMRKAGEVKEGKSVLDEEPKAGESETEVRAGETIAEKSMPEKAVEIRRQVEEELRENPIRLSDTEFQHFSREFLHKRKSAILDSVSENVKDKYSNHSKVEQAMQYMLQNMVDNKVIPESEKQSFCSEGAFYEFLQEGYDAENIRLAGPWDTIKKAFFGVPIIQQIKVLREIATKGELLVLPKTDGHKTVFPLEDFKRMVDINDSNFNLDFQNDREYAKRKILAEREAATVNLEVAKRLEVDEKLTEQAKKEIAGKEEGKNPVINSKSSEKSKEPEIEESISREDIEKVSSFEELDALLAKSGSIIGSRGKSYDTEKLRSLIKKHIIGVEELIRAKVSEKEIKKHITDEANFLFKNITRSAGLRDKVIELLLSMSGHPEESTERKKKKRKEKKTKNEK